MATKSRKEANMNNFIEVTQHIPVSFDAATKNRWFRLTNKAMTGCEEVAEDHEASELHKSIHWYVNCCRTVKVKFRLYADGSLEVIPEPSFQKANHETYHR